MASPISGLLADLQLVRSKRLEADELAEALKSDEEVIKRELYGLMLDNDIEKTSTPDGRWSVARTKTKKLNVRDKAALIGYLMAKRPELLSVDMVETKKLIGKDPKVSDQFDVSYEESLRISEVKEKVEQVETNNQWRDRVRAAQADAAK